MDDHQKTGYGMNNPGYYYQQQTGQYPQYTHSQYPPNQIPGQAPAKPEGNGYMQGWFNYKSPGYLKGLLVGAGVALVLGHPKIRKSIISGAVSTWDTVSGSFEELKEQVEDVRAEKSEQND